MSYLLDALKKADGKETTGAAPVGQPQPMVVVNKGSGAFIWLSVVLAVLLALTVGYLLGNRYTLSNEQERVTQIVPQPVVIQTQPAAPANGTTTNTTALNTQPQSTVAVSTETDPQTPSNINTGDVATSNTQTASLDAQTNQSNQVQGVTAAVTEAKPEDESQLVVVPNADGVTVSLQPEERVLGYQPGKDNSVKSEQRKEQEAIAEELGGKLLTNKVDEAEVAMDQIPADLVDQFRRAVSASVSSEAPDDAFGETDAEDDIKPLTQLPPSVQQRVPAMSFDTHIYASEASQRWIKVNGKVVQEKQWITAEVQVVRIEPQYVVLQMDYYLFTLPALSEWGG